jgi:uncharacterized protein YjcR
MCSQGLDLLSMQESAFDHDLTLLQKVMNAAGVCIRSRHIMNVTHINTGMNDLQKYFYAQRVMMTRLS